MEFRTRKLIMPAHLNGAGTLFGGQAMAWIDEESAIFAMCQLGGKTSIVTKAMDAIDFKTPAHAGDIIEIGAALVAMGRTSITVSCAIRNKTTGKEIVRVDKIVFVHVDENGNAVPHGVAATVSA